MGMRLGLPLQRQAAAMAFNAAYDALIIRGTNWDLQDQHPNRIQSGAILTEGRNESGNDQDTNPNIQVPNDHG